MAAPRQVVDLVERFDRNLESYRSSAYNETQLRREFLDPFFKALGWDVDNEKGYAEAYKDVIHEDAIKIGGETKAPDYCFRIGGTRKFFLEAKKPAVNLKHDIHPAFQLRRYAWSAKLPLSILTDFEEFVVYDCRVRPLKTDKPDRARVMYVTYADYPDRWHEIADTFAREQVLKGSFDNYAESSKAKKGTAEVDAAFLKDIESWRDTLARNFALRNPNLTQRELNFAVQRTIDRVIFLRMCEDRAIEPYAQLRGLRNGAHIYRRLGELFRRADERYNSSLFYFAPEKGREPPDEMTLALALDDKPLKDILGGLYYPDSPYEFSVLPADILGQVYEQFLGKVIRLTKGHHAVVEDKPEVKKAGGVYYTPTYIVDYIVKHTVGNLLGATDPRQGEKREGEAPAEPNRDTQATAEPQREGEAPAEPNAKAPANPKQPRRPTPKDIANLRVLDPACGSGSFLIAAYQYLLDWYRDWYIQDGPDKYARDGAPAASTGKRSRKRLPAPLCQGPRGDWRLTTAERKRILLAHVFGVDIDPQAVEVTKLSLLLKVLEGESQQTLDNQLRLFHERALPDLNDNVKCGNSLIGPDFYDDQQMSFLDEDERYRINVFDWNAEFPQIMNAGGFDAIIGNPPYIRIQAMKEWAPIEVEHYKGAYRAASKGNYDIYVVFVERGLQLLNPTGRLGFILPHKFFNAKYGSPLRAQLSAGKNLSEVVHFGDQQVFRGPTTYTCLLFLRKSGSERFHFVRITDVALWRAGGYAPQGLISADQATHSEWNFAVGPGADLIQRLAAMPVKLGDIAEIFVGLQTSADTVFLFKDCETASADLTTVYSKELDESVALEPSLLKPVVRSGSIGRFWAKPTALVLFPYLIVDGQYQLVSEPRMKQAFPRTWAYLTRNRQLLTEREHGRFAKTGWYQLYPKNLNTWDQPKIMLPYMTTRLSAFYDESGYYFVNVTTGGFGVTLHEGYGAPAYVTALLNSRLLDWFFRNISTTFHGGYFAANKQFLVQLPLRVIDFSNSADDTLHSRVVDLSTQMQATHKLLAAAKTAHEQASLQRQIDATDRQIDALVYELYALTDDEIRIVEEATTS